MTGKLTLHTPQYAALLARWRVLCDKRDDDGLTPREVRELAHVNEQMGAIEFPKGEQGKDV